ncbi:CUBN [Mytilus coruscus]|uniref:CUBN n=1 Tax=Mytilus coruscus TaxID=42192 RepID=A0A6J8EH69_MYTCO|nr:CUBN [Mytilus coruscus]
MTKFCWLILLSTCFAKVYSQCSGSTLVVELQLFTTIYIESPNFQSGNYSQNLNCSWRVITSLNASSLLYRVQLKAMMNTIDILKIFKGLDDTGEVLIDTTNNDSPDRTLSGTASVEGLYVQFTSDDNPTNNGKGFTLNIIEASDMSGTACSNTSFLEAESTPKFITSPKFPNNYLDDTKCLWNISCTDNSVIVISVIYMDIEEQSSDSCYDSLKIGDSGELCASDQWHNKSLYAYNDSVSINFISDNQQNKRGFVLSYMMLMKDSKTTENIEEQKSSTQPQAASKSSLSITTSSQIIVTVDSSTELANTSLLFSTITELPSTIETTDQSTTTKDSSSSLFSTILEESKSTDSNVSSTHTRSTSLLSTTTFTQTTDTTDSTTWPQSTSIASPTTIDSVTAETSSIFSTIALETTTEDIEQFTTIIAKSEVENQSTLPSAAVGGIITAAIIGVAGLGALLAVIAYLMIKYTGGKHEKNTNLRNTTNTRVTDNGTPSWITLIDTMKRPGYDPVFLDIDNT